MPFNLHETVYNQLHAVDVTLDNLENIGLVTAKNADVARAAMTRAQHAEHLAHVYDGHVTALAVQAGEQLADTDELDLGTLIDTLSAPPAEQVERALQEIWHTNVRAARKAAFANIAKAPDVLNKHFQDIAEQAKKVRAKLGAVSTADEAIELELHREWLQVAELRDQHNAVASLRGDLRSFGLLPGPDGYNAGWSWNYRKEPQVGAMSRARELQDGGRAVFLLGVAAEPYCPASREEAEAVLKAAQTPQAAL